MTAYVKMVVGVILMSVIAINCSSKKSDKGEQREQFKSGLVFDVGGRGDKSFNDAAFRGVDMAKEKFGIRYEYIEPGEGADREAALRQLSSQGDIAIIIGAGFIFTDDITSVAKEFPNKNYVCIDYSVDTSKTIPEIKLFCMDILDYELPPDPLLLYMFHPFERPVMERFRRKVEDDLERKPRPLAVAYVAPRCAEVWDSSHVFVRRLEGPNWKVWLTWLNE